MKISNINFNYPSPYKKILQKNNERQDNGIMLQTNYASIPSTSQYLSFCAGYSLKLSETLNNLLPDKHEYPLDIYDMAHRELERGNPDNKTLYDIHFDKYKGVLDCYSLKELKDKYPEFNNVISAYNVEAKDNSFVGIYQNNESELFDINEDLSLQLIKLYWGQGFSLSGLSNYIKDNSKNSEGINLYYTMAKKLNIPLMNPHYANVLKLSNKEYNEKFSEQMSIKRKEAAEARLQKSEGEPVIIPRGPLTEAHKKHISEGLRKYYEENPEETYKISARQKEFFANNPKYREQISEAMDYAWNRTREGKGIKRQLIKFLRKQNVMISDDELTLKKELSTQNRKSLEDFWNKNPWAKGQFSIATKLGWAWAKEDLSEIFDGKTIPDVKISFNIIPTQVRNRVGTWAAKNGFEEAKNENFGLAVIYKDSKVTESRKCREKTQKMTKIMDEFSKTHPNSDNNIASAMQLALIQFVKDMETDSKNLPENIRHNKGAKFIFEQLVTNFGGENIIYRQMGNYTKYPINGVDIASISRIYTDIMHFALKYNFVELAAYMDDNFDKMFSLVENKKVDIKMFI